jgi:hypothetical protein
VLYIISMTQPQTTIRNTVNDLLLSDGMKEIYIFFIENPDFHPYLKRKEKIEKLKILCKNPVIPIDIQNSDQIQVDQYNQLIGNCVPHEVVWQFNTLYFRKLYHKDQCTYILDRITKIVEEYMITMNQESALELLDELCKEIVSIWNDFYTSNENWKIDHRTGNALHDVSNLVFKLDHLPPIYLGTSSYFDSDANKMKTCYVFVDSTTGCIIIREYKKNDEDDRTKHYLFFNYIISVIIENLYHQNRNEMNYLKKALVSLFEKYEISNKLPEYLDKFLEYGKLIMMNIGCGNDEHIFSIELQLNILCEYVVNQHMNVEIIDYFWRNGLPPV